MEALTKILAELREGDIGSFFSAISKQCRSFFDNVSPDDSLAGPRAPGPGRGLPGDSGAEGQQVSLGADVSIGQTWALVRKIWFSGSWDPSPCYQGVSFPF